MALTPSGAAALTAGIRRLSQSLSGSPNADGNAGNAGDAILGATSAGNSAAASAVSDIVTLSRNALGAANQASSARAGQNLSAGSLFGAIRSLFNRPRNQSLSSSLSNLLQQIPNRTSKFDSLFKRIGGMLDELRDKNPELVKKLEILLATLEKLTGQVLDHDGFLTKFEQVLSDLQSHSKPFQLSDGASSQTGQAASGAPATPQYEKVTIAIEFEISSSSSMEATIAEMNEQGLRVQQIKVEESQSIKLRIEFTGIREVQQQSEPLALDLDGGGIQLTDSAQGINFDINGDGATDRVAFTRNDGFLAMDRDGNGRIDSGKELFGDQNGAINGFEELAKLDDNRDGVIDARDAAYKALGAIRDANADGQLDPSEFMSLDKLGIQAINLINELQREDDGLGNTLAERGTFVWSDGRQGKTADVWLGYTPGQTIQKTA